MFAHEGPTLGPDDDGFHACSDNWWETETAWFSFNVPERRMGGWLYNQVLAVQGVCNGGAWVWDDSGPGRYERNEQGLPMPRGLDLRDVALPNGNAIRVLEPLMRYDLTYSDPGAFEATLTFEGVMAPHSHPLGIAPFWKGRHFDQPGRVRGEIVLGGERIVVDCFSGRDRSWGPRPRGSKQPSKPRPVTAIGYALATASAEDGFLAYTQPHEDGSDELTAGYLLRGGAYAPLVQGRRVATYDPATRCIRALHLEATDELGRVLEADGELVSRHGDRGPSGTGLFLWRWDGIEAWGEDQSYGAEKAFGF